MSREEMYESIESMTIGLQYNTNMPFLPQIESNTEGLFDLLKNIPRLKRMVQNAGRA